MTNEPVDQSLRNTPAYLKQLDKFADGRPCWGYCLAIKMCGQIIGYYFGSCFAYRLIGRLEEQLLGDIQRGGWIYHRARALQRLVDLGFELELMSCIELDCTLVSEAAETYDRPMAEYFKSLGLKVLGY